MMCGYSAWKHVLKHCMPMDIHSLHEALRRTLVCIRSAVCAGAAALEVCASSIRRSARGASAPATTLTSSQTHKCTTATQVMALSIDVARPTAEARLTELLAQAADRRTPALHYLLPLLRRRIGGLSAVNDSVAKGLLLLLLRQHVASKGHREGAGNMRALATTAAQCIIVGPRSDAILAHRALALLKGVNLAMRDDGGHEAAPALRAVEESGALTDPQIDLLLAKWDTTPATRGRMCAAASPVAHLSNPFVFLNLLSSAAQAHTMHNEVQCTLCPRSTTHCVHALRCVCIRHAPCAS